jgi:tRNA G18 (ribose-2'-O)-methylase SpoU
MESKKVGVGPHPKPWPKIEGYDESLLENGDTRNVADKFRYKTVEHIKTELSKNSHALNIAIENSQHDFNIGTIVRSANAFNVGAVHIIGRRHWNRRGAMVTDKYLSIFNHATVEDFVVTMRSENREIIAVDNVEQSHNLSETKLPRNCVLVFGGEGPGLSHELLATADQIVQIEQFGSTRSINVGVAAGIVMYAWVQQNALVRG